MTIRLTVFCERGGESVDGIAEIFGGIVGQSHVSIAPNDSDYEKDGLLYCGRCHTPKQTRIEVFGSVVTPMCLCKCEAERIALEKAKADFADKMDRVSRLRKVGFADGDMASWTFANDDRSNPYVSDIAQRYVQNFQRMRSEHKGLLLYGKVGTGKTYISACIANALIDRGVPCMVTNFARLVNTIQGMREGRQEYLDDLSEFDLLVIDDLASERDTEYMQETIMNIIDARYRSGLPLIVTTNLSSAELKNPADIRKQRIYSRIFEMCVPVEVKGQDRRKEKLKADYSEYKELLGI